MWCIPFPHYNPTRRNYIFTIWPVHSAIADSALGTALALPAANAMGPPQYLHADIAERCGGHARLGELREEVYTRSDHGHLT